jgi:hypothetical protein
MSDPNTKNCDDNFSKALNEITKVINDNGTFFYFSTSKPDKRISNLTAIFNGKIEIEEISKIIYFY